jgi:hypothetical protein
MNWFLPARCCGSTPQQPSRASGSRFGLDELANAIHVHRRLTFRLIAPVNRTAAGVDALSSSRD